MGPFFALSGFAGRFLFSAQRAALVQTPDFRGVGKSPLLFLGVGASGGSLLRGSFLRLSSKCLIDLWCIA